MYGSNCLGTPSVPEGEVPPWSVVYRRVYAGGGASKGQHSPLSCCLEVTEIGGKGNYRKFRACIDTFNISTSAS